MNNSPSLTLQLSLLFGLGSLIFANPSSAAVLNGSFESGITGWTATGDVSIQTSAYGSTPTDGNAIALLTTASLLEPDGNLNCSGSNQPVSANCLETVFLGLSLNSLNDPNNPFFGVAREGSGIKQTFTVQAGDRLTLDWNFLTADPSADNQDYAFIVLSELSNLSNLSYDNLPKLNNTAGLITSNTLFGNETGFKPFSYTFTESGTYTLGIGVVDVGDFEVSSGVLVDNINLTNRDEKIPEPSSLFGLLALGISGTISALTRKSSL